MHLKKFILVLSFLELFVFSSFGAESFNLPRIEKLRFLDTKLNLFNGGFIVVPNDSNYAELANKINDKFQKLVKTEYIIDTKFEIKPSQGQVIIVLGNMINNPIIENLYWNFYTYVNPTWPGEKGYVIETIYQPLPFFSKNNMIVLGGSNLTTTTKAVDSFLDGLKTSEDCQIVPTLKVVNAALNEDVWDYKKAKGLRGFRGFAGYYHQTGEKKHLDQAMAFLDEHCKKAEENPDWILGWSDEIDSFRVVCAWDFVQEHLKISGVDRLRYEQFFLDFINKLAARADVDKIKPGPVAAWNHTTIPLIGMYASARYYQTHYGFDLQYILDKVKMYLDGQKMNYHVSCDAQFYAYFSLEFCMTYYAAANDWEYFDNGNARKMCDWIFLQFDNNGISSGAGDSRPNFGPDDRYCWDMLDYKIKIPEMFWFRKQANMPDKLCKSKFYPDVKPQRPNYLEGCIALPMEKGIYDLAISKSSDLKMLAQASVPESPLITPLEKSFDKLQFRSFTDNGGEYLLVDGFGRGNHGHFDTGAIICATFDGCRFLTDRDYLVSKSNEHNMLTIAKDGKSEMPVPPFAELVCKVDFNDGAYTCTSVKNYNDADWDRHILWLKDKYFAVLDIAKARKAGNFKIDCTWKVLDRGMEDFNGTELICKGPGSNDVVKDIPTRTFHLRSVDKGWQDHKICEDDEKTWIIHQSKTLEAKENDLTSWQNIFYIERKDEKGQISQYNPIKLTDTILQISSDSNAVIIVGDQKAQGIEITADYIYASNNEILLVNAQKIKADEEILLDSPSPITKWCSLDEIKDTNNAKLMQLSQIVLSKFKVSPKVKKIEVRPAQLKSLWQFGGKLPVLQERDLSVGDINKDGKAEILFCANKNLYCFDAKGIKLWEYEHSDDIYSCLAANLNSAAVLAGTKDGCILAFDSMGEFLKSVKIKQASSGQYGMQSKNWITHLNKRDFNNDGKEEIVAGLRSWQIHIFDSNLNPLWYNSLVLHGISEIDFSSGRQMPDLLYAADLYGGVYAFDIYKDKPEIMYRKSFTSIGTTRIVVYDINKDCVDDMVAASEGGRMSAFDGKSENKNKTIWSLNNYGFGYSDVNIVRGDKPLMISSSLSGYLHVMDLTNGKIKNVIDAMEPVSVFEIINDKIIAGTQSSFVVVMDFNGTILSKSKVSGSVLKIKLINNEGFAVMTTDGQISVFKVKE
ncbi:MAG: hypothetical protein A2Y10_03060 [Planctomycetes bacterium GWF2_41_51]|nr:MAG: hypothetical protein A2Y10_03060 [Planctomycetes bacterium GWF2_41_51]HBG26064.1 hypothetical protein [Phycisphaerales bacterium]